jgi:hypothetical protein
VDPEHPFHFICEGTGEHFFWNGLTTSALMGWRDEVHVRQIIDRAARLKINRLRVSLNGPRVPDVSRWYEPVKPSEQFRFLFGPWVGAQPDNVRDPGWDVTRFGVAFWQKYERLVRHARERDVVISVIFFLDGRDPGADPFGKAKMLGGDEKRFYSYAAALRALVLLMRFSGMRIGDCVTLSRDRLNGSNLLLYTQKTRVSVYCPLPPGVAQALHSAPYTNKEFFFWTGEFEAKSSVGNWQRSLRKLFKLAGVPDGHAH